MANEPVLLWFGFILVLLYYSHPVVAFGTIIYVAIKLFRGEFHQDKKSNYKEKITQRSSQVEKPKSKTKFKTSKSICCTKQVSHLVIDSLHDRDDTSSDQLGQEHLTEAGLERRGLHPPYCHPTLEDQRRTICCTVNGISGNADKLNNKSAVENRYKICDSPSLNSISTQTSHPVATQRQKLNKPAHKRKTKHQVETTSRKSKMASNWDEPTGSYVTVNDTDQMTEENAETIGEVDASQQTASSEDHWSGASSKRKPAAPVSSGDVKRNRVSRENSLVSGVAAELDMMDVNNSSRGDEMNIRISELVAQATEALNSGQQEVAKRLTLEAVVGAQEAKDIFLKGVPSDITCQDLNFWFDTCTAILMQCGCLAQAITCYYTASVFDLEWDIYKHTFVTSMLLKSYIWTQPIAQLHLDYRKVYGTLHEVYLLAKLAERRKRYRVATVICTELEIVYRALFRKYGLCPSGFVGPQADPKAVTAVLPVLLCSARCAAATGESQRVRQLCSTVLATFCDYDNVEALELWGRTLYKDGEYDLAASRILTALKHAEDAKDRTRLTELAAEINAQRQNCKPETNEPDDEWLEGTQALQQKGIRSSKSQVKPGKPVTNKENKYSHHGHLNKKSKHHMYSRYKDPVLSPLVSAPEINQKRKRKVKSTEDPLQSTNDCIKNPIVQKLQRIPTPTKVTRGTKRSRESSICSTTTTATESSFQNDDLWIDMESDDESTDDMSVVSSHIVEDDTEAMQSEETSFYERSCQVHFSDTNESDNLLSDKKLLQSGVQLNASFLHRFEDRHPLVLGRDAFYDVFLSQDELRECLLKQPHIFKRCILQIEGSHLAYCTPIVSDGVISTIEISGRSKAGQAFNEDEVVVQLLDTTHEKSDKRYGKVIGVLKRTKHSDVSHPVFVCTLDDVESHLVRPMCKTVPKVHVLDKVTRDHRKEYKKFKVEIYKYDHVNGTLDDPSVVDLSPSDRNKYLFLVAYINWSHRHIYPRGAVIKMLPFCTTIGRGIALLDLQHEVPKLYSKPTTEQVESMTLRDVCEFDSETLSDREDLTALVTFTIDPPGSRDLDDALSIEKLADCFKVGVHIADVSAFVSKGDPLDDEAKERAMSFYPGIDGWRPRPMLPEPCSANFCSLLPDQVRLTLSVFFYLDDEGRPIQTEGSNFEIKKSYIKSCRQLTYREAQNIISEQKQDEPCSAEVLALYKLARFIRKKRLGNAMYALDLVDEEENDEDSVTETLEAHYLVEEFMIMANKKVAHVLTRKYPNTVPIRCQPPPSKENLESFVQNNNAFMDVLLRLQDKPICGKTPRLENALCQSNIPDGQSCPKVIVSSKLWNSILAADTNASKCLRTDDLHPLQHLVYQHWLSIQERALYSCSGSVSSEEKKHYSLNLTPYTHFTSPIRRFCDIVVHRHLHALLDKEASPYEQDEVEAICIHINSVMKRSKEYSKGCKALKQAVELKERPKMIRCFVDDISDRSVTLCAPELKYVAKLHRELPFNLLDMGSKPEPASDAITNQSKVTATWKKRLYDNRGISISPDDKGRTLTLNAHPGAIFIPVRQWAKLVQCAVDNRLKDLKTNIERTEAYRSEFGVEDVSTECLDPDEMQPNTTFQLSFTQGQTLNIQMSAAAQKGILAPRPVLFNMTNNVKCCLQHMDDPVLHLYHYSTRPTQDQYKTTKLYLERWLPLILMESATGAVTNEEGCTINNVPVKFSGDCRRGKIAFHLGYCEARNIEFSGTIDDEEDADSSNLGVDTNAYDWLCLKYLHTQQNRVNASDISQADALKCMWVGHAVVNKVERRKEEGAAGKLIVHFILHDRAESPPLEARAKSSLFSVEVLYKAEVDRRTEKFIKCLPQSGEDSLAVKIALNNAPIPPLDKDRVHTAEELPERDLFILPGGNIHPLPRNNELQQDAVDNALMSRFSLIQGPPGTGKTYTGIKLICLFDKINQIMSKMGSEGGRKQVLFCGPSNKSVDLVARWMLNRLGHLKPKFVRVYGRAIEAMDYPVPGRAFLSKKSTRNLRADDSIKDVTLHHIIRQKGKKYAEIINAFDKKFKQLREEGKHPETADVREYVHIVREASIYEIRQYDVILCTTAVGSNPKILEATKVFQVIVDEAGMCPEPQCLVPIIATNAQQVVLIGDHMQLRPIIMCKAAAELGMETSLFERYALSKSSRNVKFTMLEMQYRMNPQLCRFPSKHFYDDRLVTKNGLWAKDAMAIWPENRGTSVPHVFVHVEGEEKMLTVSTEDGNECSRSNAAEVDLVVKVFAYLINEGVPDRAINVVSQYNAQCSLLKETLKKHFSNFSVNTVVSSQGGEWDYVIFSTVRSLPDYKIEQNPTLGWCKQNLGFITDGNQINVALTRARKGLIIIGNQKLLQCDKIWRKLVNHYERDGCLKTPLQFPPPPRTRRQKMEEAKRKTREKHGDEMFISGVDQTTFYEGPIDEEDWQTSGRRRRGDGGSHAPRFQKRH